MLKVLAAAAAVLMSLGGIAQADTVKVGVIGAFSGPFSLYGTGWRQAFEVYMKQHGGQIAGHDIEFVYRDLPASNPQQARALAQELIIRDEVQYLAGFVFTADAMAVAPLATEAKVPTIVLNAGSSALMPASDYFLRTSFTTYQVATPVAKFAAEEGAKTAITMVSDYVPGVEEEKAFTAAFEAAGGKVLESMRMPLSTTDFAPYLQRGRTAKPDVIFAFLPGGPSTYSYVRTYLDSGMKDSGIRFLGTGETQEFDLQAMGEMAIGLETGFVYSSAHPGETNQQYLKDLEAMHPGAVASLSHTEAYDAMAVISKMVEATGGKRDGATAVNAAKGMEWEGLRGPLRIEAETRDLIQNVYMRIVERDPANNLLVNREFRTFEMQPDYGRGQ